MAGLRGNTAWWMFGSNVKGAKGAPRVVSAAETTAELQEVFRVPFTGGDIAPNPVFGQLAETDESRDQGVSYAKSSGVAGTPECYAREAAVGALLYYACGTDTASGATTKRVHKITPSATTLPYITVWKMLSTTSILCEEYKDCFVNTLNLKAAAGEPLTATVGIAGLTSKWVTGTEPQKKTSTVIPLESSTTYNFNDALVKLGGAETHKVANFDFTLNNNITPLQTDDFTPTDLSIGQRQIELSFDLVIENAEEYKEWIYDGTTKEQSTELFTKEFEFEFKHATDKTMIFKFPKIAFESYPITPNVTGAPVIASIKGIAQRNTPIMEATIKNEVAKYVEP